MHWHEHTNKRVMPWKGERDPYKIWLSEIILQQTRVDQGTAYFEKFISAFPNIQQLASAPDEKVYKLWEGLGYYSRCANLLATAREISNERHGEFPKTFDEVIALKGVGNYTASAIMSFAYNKPYAVLDGNVFRVLSRFFGVDIQIDSTEGKKYFSTLADKLIEKKKPALYNQAIMDFGAVVCKPALPMCGTCNLSKHCIAFNFQRVALLPVKKKKIKQQKRFFNYVVISCKGRVLVRQRRNKDIWKNLNEFILIETNNTASIKELLERNVFKKNITSTEAPFVSKTYQQKLTHQLITVIFVHIKIAEPFATNDFIWVDKKGLEKLAFPRVFHSYFKDNLVSLNL
ncbi:MAG: A/G-specific adenine glycosylase [Bacteroidetes bacterium]|nr:A/G-specific adenine glycosylase [Bacteroidota bacterium]